MASTAWWDRPLAHWQLWLLCTAALALHVLPLLMADMPFLDDLARQQLARNDWGFVGRPLVVGLYAALSFGPGALNLYPLPLLLALLACGHGLACLVQRWFNVPALGAVLVVLPLWYQPYFLQNLSYQYDGASMALALAACLWAIALGPTGWRGWLSGALLVAVGAGLYQPAVNLFAGLCGIDLMRQLMHAGRLQALWREALQRLGQLLAGCALYYASCAWMVTSTRADWLPLDGHWLGEVLRRLGVTADTVGVLLTPAAGWLMLVLCLLAALALGRSVIRLWQGPGTANERLGLVLTLLGLVPLIALCVPGLILLLAEFEQSVRVLLGLGALLAMLSYLAHEALAGWPRLRLLLLAVPLLCMLGYSFAYGRVLVLQKALHQSMAQALVHDLASQDGLRQARHYYLLDYWLERPWIPAARGTLQALPALGKIHAYNYLLLPEMLPRAGIDDLHTFYQAPPLNHQQVLARSPAPQLSSRFYDIHLVDDAAYVLIKAPPQ